MALRRLRLAEPPPATTVAAGEMFDVRTAYQEYGRELYGFALRRSPDHHAAEEAVQETFLRAWRAAERYDAGVGPVRAWLYAILRNVLIDAARAASIRPTLAAAEPEGFAAGVDAATDGASTDGAIDAALDGWILEEALRRLRADHRIMIVETYYRGRSYADVAAQLGIPEGTARSRAFYGLKALRLTLEEMGWTP